MNQGVPLSAVLALVGTLLVFIFITAMRYIQKGFDRNESDHGLIYKMLDRMGKRIDHIIKHHRPQMPPYDDDD